MTCGAPEINSEPLESDRVVLRVVSLDSEGSLNPGSFELSSRDKKESPPQLSVWALGCTEIDQISALLDLAQAPMLAQCKVEQIRQINVTPDHPPVPAVDVIWSWIGNDLPGKDGHCGIVNLLRPEGLSNGKAIYMLLRRKMADAFTLVEPAV
jgi:hypothetical protein